MRYAIIAAFLVATLGNTALAKDRDKGARPEMFQKLIDCKAIADNGARLACYDAQVTQLDNAEQNREIVMMDKKQVEETQRAKFGYDINLPDAFKTADGKDLDQIETTIATAGDLGADNIFFTVPDGARWVQTDNRAIGSMPKPGQPVVIKKAAMGTFLAKIGTRPAVRVKRVR